MTARVRARERRCDLVFLVVLAVVGDGVGADETDKLGAVIARRISTDLECDFFAWSRGPGPCVANDGFLREPQIDELRLRAARSCDDTGDSRRCQAAHKECPS